MDDLAIELDDIDDLPPPYPGNPVNSKILDSKWMNLLQIKKIFQQDLLSNINILIIFYLSDFFLSKGKQTCIHVAILKWSVGLVEAAILIFLGSDR